MGCFTVGSLCLLLFSIPSTTAQNHIQVAQFELFQNTVYRASALDKLITNITGTLASSRIKCAQLCLNHVLCETSTHYKTSQICSLYGERYNLGQLVSADSQGTSVISLRHMAPQEATTNITTMPTTTTTDTTSVANRTVVAYQYSSKLTSNSSKMCRESNCLVDTYFEAIEIIASVHGNYTIETNSSMDTYGYLYITDFDTIYWMNDLLLVDDDDAGVGYNFLLSFTLQAMIRYILVTTTFGPGITGSFVVLTTGPGMITFTPLNISMPASNITVQSPAYSSTLTNNSLKFCLNPPCTEQNKTYCTVLQFNISITGRYIIFGNSSMHTLALLYNNAFDPNDAYANALTYGVDDGGNGEFLFDFIFFASRSYAIAVTTLFPLTIGNFSVTTQGPATINYVNP